MITVRDAPKIASLYALEKAGAGHLVLLERQLRLQRLIVALVEVDLVLLNIEKLLNHAKELRLNTHNNR